MEQKTNKEMLLLMSAKIDKLATDQFQLSCDFSNHINSTDLKFKEILNLLESNDKTKQKGAIEQVSVNTKDISTLKNDKKIVYGMGIGIAFLSNFLMKYFWK